MVGKDHDPVNHPRHYNKHPSGIECIDVTEHFNFNQGNAIKYIWRAGEKGDAIEDLQKAKWYLDREIERRRREDQVRRSETVPVDPTSEERVANAE